MSQMSQELRVQRGRQSPDERAARIAAAVAVERIDLLPPPLRANEFRELVVLLANHIGDPRGAFRELASYADGDGRLAA